MAAATIDRSNESAEFKAKNGDQASSVDALRRAIKRLKSETSKKAQVGLLHTLSRNVPGMPLVLLALESENNQSKQAPAWEAPKAAAYEFQSGNVIGMLESLLKSFETDRADLIKVETSKKQFYEVDIQAKNRQIEYNTRDREVLDKKKTVTMASLTKARQEKVNTVESKQEDSKLLLETEKTFRSKTADFNENQRVRKDELEALEKAIKIIGSDSVAGAYAEHTKYGGQPAVFLQFRRSMGSTSVRQRVSDLLASKSRALASRDLAAIAASASAGPLDKVIGMIEDLIQKLGTDSAAEEEHATFCQAEVAATSATIDDKTTEISELNLQAENLRVSIEEQSNAISTNSAARAELIESIATATEIRTKEKEANAHAISDANEGIAGVKNAIMILDTFYNGDSGDAYTGQFSSGVMDMLQVIQTDLERLLSDTTEAETSAAEQFSEDIPGMETDAKEKQEHQHAAERLKDEYEFELGQRNKEIASEKKELAAASAYFEKLRPSCVEVKVDYKVRVQKREEEIQALRQAFEILDSKGSL